MSIKKVDVSPPSPLFIARGIDFGSFGMHSTSGEVERVGERWNELNELHFFHPLRLPLVSSSPEVEHISLASDLKGLLPTSQEIEDKLINMSSF